MSSYPDPINDVTWLRDQLRSLQVQLSETNANRALATVGNLDGGKPDSNFGGINAVSGGTP